MSAVLARVTSYYQIKRLKLEINFLFICHHEKIDLPAKNIFVKPFSVAFLILDTMVECCYFSSFESMQKTNCAAIHLERAPMILGNTCGVEAI